MLEFFIPLLVLTYVASRYTVHYNVVTKQYFSLMKLCMKIYLNNGVQATWHCHHYISYWYENIGSPSNCPIQKNWNLSQLSVQQGFVKIHKHAQKSYAVCDKRLVYLRYRDLCILGIEISGSFVCCSHTKRSKVSLIGFYDWLPLWLWNFCLQKTM